MWSPQRDAVDDEWRAAETNIACALVGFALTHADGRAMGVGAALLVFAVIVGLIGFLVFLTLFFSLSIWEKIGAAFGL